MHRDCKISFKLSTGNQELGFSQCCRGFWHCYLTCHSCPLWWQLEWPNQIRKKWKCAPTHLIVLVFQYLKTDKNSQLWLVSVGLSTSWNSHIFIKMTVMLYCLIMFFSTRLFHKGSYIAQAGIEFFIHLKIILNLGHLPTNMVLLR